MNFKIKTPRDKKYIEWIRNLPCIICQYPAPSDPHHASTGGKGIKCSDYETIPLCHKHHTEIHNTGKTSFQAKYDLDVGIVCQSLQLIYSVNCVPNGATK